MTDKNQLFSSLIEKELPMLRRVAYRVLGNPDDTDEAVQEALLKAWERFGDFRSEAKLSSWICRIVVNESYNLIRNRQREAQKVAEMTGFDPDNPEEKEDQFGRLEEAIAQLPEVYRQTVQLAILENVDTKIAAERLKCNINTLYWRIQKSKRLLRLALQEVQS